MASTFYEKFPAEIIDFPVDCSGALPDSDTISVGGASVTSDDLDVDDSRTAISSDGKSINFWCSGGEAGRVAKVVISIQTAGGRFRQTHAFIVIKPL